MPDRIDLNQADDPRDVIHQAVACLAQGQLLALVSSGGFSLVAAALNSESVQHLGRAIDTTAATQRPTTTAERTGPTLLLRAIEELGDWVHAGPLAAPKLPGRVWPGPVILRFPSSRQPLLDRLPASVRSLLLVADQIAVQVPANRILRELTRLSVGPLIEWEAFTGRSPDPTATSTQLDDLSNLDGIGMILDTGDPSAGHRPTVVAIDREHWSVVRPGAVSERSITERVATIVLFICTGNTCRSPMAEALCKATIARKLGCPVEDLVRLGYLILSAGVAASEGMPAAANAIEVVGHRGGSLVEHLSRQVTPNLVQNADHILAMTWDHLDALLDQVPAAADRVRLLDPTGGDIDDPVGLDQATYHATADAIERHIETLLQELGL